MKQKMQRYSVAAAVTIMALLIIDTKTATVGASEGVELCINVIIPSLFPFFVITSYLNASVVGYSTGFLRPIRRILRIPDGGDSLLLLGLIGGYPVGAQLIVQTYQARQISKKTARILLGYCNNAGPAFIFGVAGALFSSKLISFTLWGIHILAALLTGFLLPRPEHETVNLTNANEISVVTALKRSLSVCALTCSWVIVFKIILAYLHSLLSRFAGSHVIILLSGLLELSNGCIRLSQIPSEATRFILCSTFLSFGGICVMLQTESVTEAIGLGAYIPGKIIQTSIATVVSVLLSYVLFPSEENSAFLYGCIILICILTILITQNAAKRCGNLNQNHV